MIKSKPKADPRDSTHSHPSVQRVQRNLKADFTYSEGATEAAKQRRLRTIGKENDRK